MPHIPLQQITKSSVLFIVLVLKPAYFERQCFKAGILYLPYFFFQFGIVEAWLHKRHISAKMRFNFKIAI